MLTSSRVSDVGRTPLGDYSYEDKHERCVHGDRVWRIVQIIGRLLRPAFRQLLAAISYNPPHAIAMTHRSCLSS